MGLLRAGWLATLLSIPVTTGFLAGISVHIIVGELPTLLGVSGGQGHLLVRLVHVLGEVREANPYTLALGAGVLIVTMGTARISSRVPGALIGLVGAGLAVALFHLDARGVSLLGALSVPLPHLALPALPGMDELSSMVQLALVVAMVCIMQTAAVASTFPSDEGKPDNVSRDFAEVGAGSILAGLIGAFAVDSSPPSTAIVHESGGRSQIASLTAVALMIALAVLAAGLMAYVPHAALSGILVYIALRIFRVDEMMRDLSLQPPRNPVGGGKRGLVIALPIETGMLLAIVLSFVHSLYIVARPFCVELARVPGTTVWWPPGQEGKASTRLGCWSSHPPRRSTSPMPSASAADQVSHRCQAAAREAAGHRGQRHHRHRLYGSQILRRAIAELRAANIVVALARLSDERAQAQAHRTGLIEAIGPDRVFMSVEEAVRKLGPGAEGHAGA